MQCPSCGFENMPGREQCAACSTSLSAKSPAESVMPPRAKDRTVGQRIEWTLANAPGVGAVRREIDEARRRTRPSLECLSGTWAWLTPKTLGLILLSGVSGYAHFYIIGRRQVGVWLFAVSAVMLAFAAVLVRSPVSDWLLYCVFGLSMLSMSAGIAELRRSRQGIAARTQAWVGIGLMVFGLYAGGYWALRMAASPWVNVVTAIAPTSSFVRQGDTLLLWSRGQMRRGDLVVGTIHWQDYQALTIGPLVGMPGDRVEIDRQVRINGRTVSVQLPSLAGAHDEAVAPSAYDMSAKTLGSDEYWIVPSFGDYAPSSRDILEAGSIRNADMWGRVVAIMGPAERRTLIHREPAKAE